MVGEQKAVIDDVGERIARLEFVMREAQGTVQTLQHERELAERIEKNILLVGQQLRGQTSCPKTQTDWRAGAFRSRRVQKHKRIARGEWVAGKANKRQTLTDITDKTELVPSVGLRRPMSRSTPAVPKLGPFEIAPQTALQPEPDLLLAGSCARGAFNHRLSDDDRRRLAVKAQALGRAV